MLDEHVCVCVFGCVCVCVCLCVCVCDCVSVFSPNMSAMQCLRVQAWLHYHVDGGGEGRLAPKKENYDLGVLDGGKSQQHHGNKNLSSKYNHTKDADQRLACRGHSVLEIICNIFCPDQEYTVQEVLPPPRTITYRPVPTSARICSTRHKLNSLSMHLNLRMCVRYIWTEVQLCYFKMKKKPTKLCHDHSRTKMLKLNNWRKLKGQETISHLVRKKGASKKHLLGYSFLNRPKIENKNWLHDNLSTHVKYSVFNKKAITRCLWLFWQVPRTFLVAPPKRNSLGQKQS